MTAITAKWLVLASPDPLPSQEYRAISSPQVSPHGTPDAAAPKRLSRREREILALLAVGMSGAAIAERLVLSPETVRTHVRNAMEKLGATTRSQAVAVAIERGEIARASAKPAPVAPPPDDGSDPAARRATLRALTAGIARLADVDVAALYVCDDDGLCLKPLARANADGLERLPDGTEGRIHLGEGKIGRVALEARTELLSESPFSPVIATAMQHNGKLIGVLCVGPRASRPTHRRELLLVEALGSRIAEVLAGAGDMAPGLRSALERFSVAWSGPGS